MGLIQNSINNAITTAGVASKANQILLNQRTAYENLNAAKAKAKKALFYLITDKKETNQEKNNLLETYTKVDYTKF